jgi:CHAT domain-containing protein/lipopolysaccharide biosynthesis regulator YciM
MLSNQDDQLTIRDYLLGLLDEDSRQAFEKQLLIDDELFEELTVSEDELVDQYLSGELDKATALLFKTFFLRTPERQKKLRFAKALRRYNAEHATADPKSAIQPALHTSTWKQLLFASPWRTAAFAAVILVAALGVWGIYFRQSDVDKGLIALNSAYRQQRPLEARITRFDYAPYVTTRGSEPERVNSVEQQRAELYLRNAVRDNPGAPSHHALGQFYLANRQLDKAIAQFEEAIKTSPNDAQIDADLGAAFLEKGKLEIEKSKSDNIGSESGAGLEYLTRSLEALKKALELNPNLLEARFNRALAYEANGLSAPAEADWREYLKQDSTSQWAQEARKKLELMEERKHSTSLSAEQSFQKLLSAQDADNEELVWELIGQSHTSAGNVLSNFLLDAYISQRAKGQAEQSRKLIQTLSYMGSVVLRHSQDRYVSDLFHFYQAVETPRLRILAEARSEMEKGYQLFTMSRFNDAIASYIRAKQLFDSVEDVPESTFASYRLGHCYVLQPNSKKGQSVFAELALTAQREHYKWLLAQSFYQLANVQISRNEYSKAIDSSNQALNLAEQLDDSNGIVKSLIQLAEEYRALNNRNRSLSFLERSLIALRQDPLEPMQAWQSYIGISLNLSSFNFKSAALEFQKEALRLGIEMGRPLIKSRSYQYLGLTYANLKMYDEARKQVQQAIEIGRALQDEPNGIEMVANASVQLGDINRQMGNYDEAITAYDQSLTLYDKLSFPYFACAAHKGKLLSFLAQGNDASVAQEIQIVLDLFQQFRSKITEQNQRNTFFDAEQDIYDLAIDFEYSRRTNPKRAFEYLESSRARSLRDIMRSRSNSVSQETDTELNHLLASQPPPTLSEIQRDLPPKSEIVEYSVLNDKLVIWVVTGKDLFPVPVPIAEAALNQKVQSYLNSLQQGSTNTVEVLQGAKELYDLLIKPVAGLLEQNNLLCIVPDKILNYLPFEALVSSSSGRYLVEDYRVQLAPSAGVFLDCSKIAKDKGGTEEERLLAVGNPAFDRKSFSALADLPAAAREAETIAHNYPSHRVLLGRSATIRQIKSEITRSDVAHFAVHYVVDPRSEMFSELILAKEPAAGNGSEISSGLLRASEIYKLKMPRTRLVVLSGCQTGVEQQYKGEGAVGLAYPFLGAHVPLVVASLWAVDSESTAELMIEFHKGRKLNQLPTAEALRQAQLHLLYGPDERYRQPYYWASFVTIGGQADF